MRGAVRGAAAPLSLPALAKTLGLSAGGVAGRSLGAVLEVSSCSPAHLRDDSNCAGNHAWSVRRQTCR